MPLRPYLLDPGFDVPDHTPLAAPEPEGRGGGLFQFGANWQNTIKDLQNVPKVFGSAFELENDVANGWELLTRPVYQTDLNFDLEGNLKEAGLWDDYRWNFVGVSSMDEFLYKARQIRKEQAARETLQAAGPDGVIASMVAGLLSPTTLLPFVGPGLKGAKAIGVGMAWGAVGGGLQEIPLQLNQELRTLEESGASVAFSTIVGGVLGGAVGFLNKRLEDVAGDMGVGTNHKAISTSEQRVLVQRRMTEIDELAPKAQNDNELSDLVTERMQLEGRLRDLDDAERRMTLAKEADDAIASSALGQKAAAGADVPWEGAGGLKNMLGIGEKLTRVAGPPTAVLGQKISNVGRRMMAELSTAGLRLEGNSILDREGNVIGGLPSNSGGGTVESIINSRRGDTLAKITEAYENYSDYWFGKDQGAGPFRHSRAAAAGRFTGKSVGKLNRRQFFEEVGKAMWENDVHPIPEVQKTAQSFRTYYDQLLKEAQDAGLISKEIEEITPDLSFLNRVYDTVAIARGANRFQQLLADHFQQSLKQDLDKLHAQFVQGDVRDTQRLADMDLPLAEAQALRKQFLDELKALDEADDDDLSGIEDLISQNRSALAENTRSRKKLEAQLENASTGTRRQLTDQLEKLAAERANIRARIDELRTAGGADLEARRQHKADLKRRIRALNRSRFMVEEKARAKYDKIDAFEEDSIDALDRLMHQGHRALKRSEAEGDAFAADLGRMRAALRNVQSKTAGYEQQVQALQDAVVAERTSQSATEASRVVPDEDKTLQRLFKREEQLQKSTDRFNELADDLDAFENYNFAEGGRREAEQLIRDTMAAAAERINRLNTARSKRIAKLESQIEKMDVAGWQGRRQEIVDRIKARREKTIERIRNLGGENYDPTKGTADFTDRAKEIAQLATERIQGTNMRLAGFDAMSDARGTELARALSVASLPLAREGFLVSDAEHLLHVYANTLIPDIEITNRFGPFAPDGEINHNFKLLNEEMRQRQAQAEANIRAAAADEGVEPNAEEIGKANQAIEREYKTIRNNLDAVIRRLRHQWGLPSDPTSVAYRAATLTLGLQAWRFLGGTSLAQLTDLAKPVMRYGLLRTMRHAWIPLITNLRAVKMTAADARRAFVAIETLTADRAFQMTDLLHYARRKTKFEAGIEWGTSKIGILFGFAPVTDLLKTLSAMSFNSKLMDSIDLSLNSVKTSKDRLEAIDFLQSLGLSEDYQRRIWNEMQNGGAERINGTWVPETAKWTDKAAIRAYRAALNNESGASVVTPGVEVPTWSNSSTTARLLTNLKSFALASTSKTLMAALQQRDMAVLNGVMVSLALGAVSFYLRSTLAGGATEQRMLKSIEDQNWELWVDEALDASGLLGVLSIAQQIGDDIPYLRNVVRPGALAATLQGKQVGPTTRGSGAGLVEDAFGPTADLVFTTAAILTNLDNPTRAQIHRIRQLLPMQNLLFIRRLFDQLENAVGDAMNATGQRR